jgi:hypothetical protein
MEFFQNSAINPHFAKKINNECWFAVSNNIPTFVLSF